MWRMIAAPLAEIEPRASAWVGALGGLACTIPGESMVGGGSLPGSTLPTRLVAIGGGSSRKRRDTVRKLAVRLWGMTPPIIGRISEDMLLLDPEAQRQAMEIQRVVLVEGCFDVAKPYSAGIRNAVATFGAHASHEQVSRLREIAEQAGVNGVLVFFDRDRTVSWSE